SSSRPAGRGGSLSERSERRHKAAPALEAAPRRAAAGGKGVGAEIVSQRIPSPVTQRLIDSSPQVVRRADFLGEAVRAMFRAPRVQLTALREAGEEPG